MEITNEMIYQRLEVGERQIQMIYEMLKAFKEDTNRRFEQVEGRFGQVDSRFEQIDKRFEQIDKRFDRLELQQLEDRRILMNLWEHKDHMKLDLTRTLLTVTGSLSFAVAFIVSFITGKAIIYKG